MCCDISLEPIHEMFLRGPAQGSCCRSPLCAKTDEQQMKELFDSQVYVGCVWAESGGAESGGAEFASSGCIAGLMGSKYTYLGRIEVHVGVLMQVPNAYQPEDQLYCVRAKYTAKNPDNVTVGQSLFVDCYYSWPDFFPTCRGFT